ncbi:MAG TPA: amino acid permease [Candidatus Thermoplasmatota archaeon]|nr:amino acid permease [Candidatus Thermoplasmatota archaeon]
MVDLKRSLSLWQLTVMSVGIILGAGIYVILGEAAGLSGNYIWLSFIIAAVVATLTAFSYAELSSRFPKAGAEYVYVENSFGNRAAWLVAWLLLAGSVIGGATVAMGFAQYFSVIFHTPIIAIALIMLVIIIIILIIGVQQTAKITILFTAVEIAGLVIVIFIGIPYIGSVNYFEAAQGLKGVIEAGVLIFFGYLGFEGITRLAEETKNPEKNIPKAIMYSMIITTVFYILVGISAVSVIPWQELATARAPLALVAQRVFGEQSFLILSVIALFSTFNTALMMLLTGSRLIYGIAQQEAIPKFFTMVGKRLRTPWIAIITIVVASMFFLFLGDLKTIANLTNFTIFSVFIVINASVIYFRYKKPITTGFRVPFHVGKFPVIPFLGIVTSIFMIANLTYDVLLLGLLLIVIGFIVDSILNLKYK